MSQKKKNYLQLKRNSCHGCSVEWHFLEIRNLSLNYVKNRKFDWWVLISFVIPVFLILKDCNSERFKWVGQQQELLTRLLSILWHIKSCAKLKRDYTKFQLVKSKVLVVCFIGSLVDSQVRKNLKICQIFGIWKQQRGGIFLQQHLWVKS